MELAVLALAQVAAQVVAMQPGRPIRTVVLAAPKSRVAKLYASCCWLVSGALTRLSSRMRLNASTSLRTYWIWKMNYGFR